VLRLYHRGILTRFRICFQACPVSAFLALMPATTEVGFVWDEVCERAQFQRLACGQIVCRFHLKPRQ